VAFALDQVIVAAAGAAALLGVALIDASTDAATVTVNVADCVTGPPGPWAVIV
jgi:predicted RecA/RadA family phage recombinase